jgi:hypothetical protein
VAFPTSRSPVIDSRVVRLGLGLGPPQGNARPATAARTQQRQLLLHRSLLTKLQRCPGGLLRCCRPACHRWGGGGGRKETREFDDTWQASGDAMLCSPLPARSLVPWWHAQVVLCSKYWSIASTPSHTFIHAYAQGVPVVGCSVAGLMGIGPDGNPFGES